MSTSASTQSTARTGTPETEMIRRGISGVALWGPSRHAVEIHHRLSGLALVTTQFAAAQLAYAETLAGQGADPRRIVDPLTQIALAISSNGGDLVKLDRVFCNLYAGDLAQDDQPASRIRYAA